MTRLTLLLTFYSSITFGCECRRSITSNFLSQVHKFDLIVLGTFQIDQNEKISLDIDKIYKGQFETKTIKLIQGGTDCNHWMDFRKGEKIIIGLNKSPYSEDADSYFAFGCVTSSLLLTDENIIKAAEKIPPSFDKQKIGLIKKSMKLLTIEKKIHRRIT